METAMNLSYKFKRKFEKMKKKNRNIPSVINKELI